MSMKNESHEIVILGKLSSSLLIEKLSSKVNLSKIKVVTIPTEASEEDICHFVSNASIIIGDDQGNNVITKKVIESAKNLRYIQFNSSGYDPVDLRAARDYKISVHNLPIQERSASVAEHAIMFMLVLLRKALYAHNKTSEGAWVHDDIVTYSLQGKTVGILGLGRIGKELAKRLKYFNVNIIYHNRRRLNESDEVELKVNYFELDELLSVSDIVSIHVPLTDETRRLIGNDEIAMMKEGSILLNLARGDVVDEEAIAEAVKQGKLAGVGLDVFHDEVIKSDSPLLGLENVILTPHIAGPTIDTKNAAMRAFVDNIVRMLEDIEPKFLVEYQ